MINAQPDNQIDEIGESAVQDDPALTNRLRHLERRLVSRERIGFVLLAASILLLGYGLSMESAIAWFTGGATFVAAVLVHGQLVRQARRP